MLPMGVQLMISKQARENMVQPQNARRAANLI